LIVADDAESDLADIILFTRVNWGEAQARSYIAKIRATIARIADQPGLAMRFNHRGRFYLRKRCGSHAIFARIDRQTLIIARILHVSMDVEQHLN
jgi:toxin ParE1/3/4